MRDRFRLIELLSESVYESDKNLGIIADYLLANGVIVPPCKVGTKVYVITSQTSDSRNLYIFEDVISHYRVLEDLIIMCFDNHLGQPHWNWDKVFLTREEAERALKGGGEE